MINLLPIFSLAIWTFGLQLFELDAQVSYSHEAIADKSCRISFTKNKVAINSWCARFINHKFWYGTIKMGIESLHDTKIS